MGAHHGTTISNKIQFVGEEGVGLSRNQTKIQVVQPPAGPNLHQVGGRGISGIGTVYPINPAVDDRGVVADADINIVMASPLHHYTRISLNNADPIINLIDLIVGLSSTFTLDFSNTIGLTSITFVPALINAPTFDLTINARNVLHIVGHRTSSETRYEVMNAGSGGGNVPNGTIENEHLEWDNSGAQWLAVTNSTYGATGPFATGAFLNFANDVIWAAGRTGGDDGNMELKWTTQDELDFTNSNETTVKLLLRSQHATEADALFLIQITTGDNGLAGLIATNNLAFTTGASTTNMVLSPTKVLYGTDISLDTNEIFLDNDEDSGIVSISDDIVQIFTNNIIRVAVENTLFTVGTNVDISGTGAKRNIRFIRDENLPDGTTISSIIAMSQDNVGALANYVKLDFTMESDSVTERGSLEFRFMEAGVPDVLFMQMNVDVGAIDIFKNTDMNGFTISNINGALINSLTLVTSVATDFLMLYDQTDGNLKKINVTDFDTSFIGFTADDILDMAGFDVDNVGTLEFQTADTTITSDTNGMILSVPDVTDSFAFVINAVNSLVLEKFFADWTQTVQQYTTRADPASPVAGDVYLYVKTGLGGVASVFQRQSDGTITDLATGGVSGANTALSNLASVAVNTDIISDSDGVDTLGDATHHWDDVFTETLTFRGSGANTDDTINAIYADGFGITYNVPTGVAHGHYFLINGANKLTVTVDAVTVSNINLILGTGLLQFSTAGRTIGMESNDMVFDITTSNFFHFDINDQRIISISDNLMDFKDQTDMEFGTTTGSKIGTGNTQKLAFWGATPVTQGPAYTVTNLSADRAYDANSTTLGEIADVLGTLLSDLKTQGLFA